VFCPRNRLTHRGGPGAHRARSEEGAYPLADIQPTSKASGWDASVPQCRRIPGTGHYPGSSLRIHGADRKQVPISPLGTQSTRRTTPSMGSAVSLHEQRATGYGGWSAAPSAFIMAVPPWGSRAGTPMRGSGRARSPCRSCGESPASGTTHHSQPCGFGPGFARETVRALFCLLSAVECRG
jgi:hypothetical protein